MRKQTKLVAALTTTAVLALGASMTSLAATNWVFEDGVWVYYDADGDRVTDEWKRSGSNWYWLNEDGEMATETLVEDDDDYYYVDAEGCMVTGQWVAIENEDYDGDDEDEPENHWYYFGANGKAYQASSSSTSANFKLINGERYIFDDEGKMLYGWINEDGDRETGDEDWQTGLYYCGDENDGRRRNSEWEYLDITDESYESVVDGAASPNVYDDEDQTRWFWFKSNGKKVHAEDGDKYEDETIKGKKYSFDCYGRMNSAWVMTGTSSNAVASSSNAYYGQGGPEYSMDWQYFGDPEDGARLTKGWFQAVPDELLHESKYDDGSAYWYYSDNDGNLVAGEIKTIEGKKYAFDGYGRMRTGYIGIKFEVDENGNESTKKIDSIIYSDDSVHPFDTEDDFNENMGSILEDGYKMYYFDADGVMQTGKQTLSIDGDDYTFEFSKSGSSKGQGKNGEDDDKYYIGGLMLKADRDDKYEVVKIVKDETVGTLCDLLSTEEFLAEAEKLDAVTKEVPSDEDPDDYSEYYQIDASKFVNVDYKVVNTSGKVIDTKSKAKDGDDRCYEVKNEVIKAVYVED